MSAGGRTPSSTRTPRASRSRAASSMRPWPRCPLTIRDTCERGTRALRPSSASVQPIRRRVASMRSVICGPRVASTGPGLSRPPIRGCSIGPLIHGSSVTTLSITKARVTRSTDHGETLSQKPGGTSARQGALQRGKGHFSAARWHFSAARWHFSAARWHFSAARWHFSAARWHMSPPRWPIPAGATHGIGSSVAPRSPSALRLVLRSRRRASAGRGRGARRRRGATAPSRCDDGSAAPRTTVPQPPCHPVAPVGPSAAFPTPPSRVARGGPPPAEPPLFAGGREERAGPRNVPHRTEQGGRPP